MVLPNKNYGYNLFKLKDLQTICLPANFLNYAANFIDKYVKRSTKAVFGDSEIYRQTKNLLEKYKYRIRENPAWSEDYELSNITKHSSNKKMLERLLDYDITKIEQIVEINNKLINYEKFKEIIDNDDKKLFNQMKKNLKNKKNNNLQDVISKRLNIDIREEVY